MAYTKYDPAGARRQSLWHGLLGLGAGLMEAGAPRVGAPGPSPWAAGARGFVGGQQGYMNQYNQGFLAEEKIRAAETKRAETQAWLNSMKMPPAAQVIGTASPTLPQAVVPGTALARQAAAPGTALARQAVVPGAAQAYPYGMSKAEYEMVSKMPPDMQKTFVMKLLTRKPTKPTKPKMIELWNIADGKHELVSEANYRLNPGKYMTKSQAELTGTGQPPSSPDHSKAYLVSGTISASGMAKKVHEFVKPARAMRIAMAKVTSAVDDFVLTRNAQSATVAMVAFQKALDDGAAFRESDRQMTMAAQSLTNRIRGMLERIESGGLTDAMLNQIKASMMIFASASLSLYKAGVDDWKDEAAIKGYDWGSMMPGKMYSRLFDDVIVPDWRTMPGRDITPPLVPKKGAPPPGATIVVPTTPRSFSPSPIGNGGMF